MSIRCTDCDLHEEAINPLLATGSHQLGQHNQAVIVVGEAPGFHEDKMDEPFIGPSGNILRKVYLEAMEVVELADVRLTNAVRCRPPHNTTPSPKHMAACRHHLKQDLLNWNEQYKDGITILCAGATACRQVLGCNLRSAMSNQGQALPAEWDLPGYAKAENIRVFATYHPAYLLPDRSPESINSVEDHLNLLIRHLEGEELFESEASPDTADIEMAPPVSGALPGWVWMDIETYGAVQNTATNQGASEQNQFHPAKSVALDNVLPKDILQCVSLTFRRQDQSIRHLGFIWANPDHRKNLFAWIKSLRNRKNGCYLVLMNAIFDLINSRFVSPGLRTLLRSSPPRGPAHDNGDSKSLARRTKVGSPGLPSPSHRGLRFVDLSVISYLHNEARPEKSLKDLAPLLGVTSYEDSKDRMGTYSSARDLALHRYNAKDTVATMRATEILFERIHDDYPGTSKCSNYCLEWYSDLIENALEMSEAGVLFDEPRLLKLFCSTTLEADGLKEKIKEMPGGGVVKGKGSATYVQSLVDRCVGMLPEKVDTSILKNSKVTKKLSKDAHNLNHLITLLIKFSQGKRKLHRKRKEAMEVIEAILEYRKVAKIIDSYLIPRLKGKMKKGKPDQSSLLVDGYAYPSWYIVPQISTEGEGISGGTTQGRIVCRRPGLQTDPPSIKECMISRYNPGIILCADLSQLEYRMGALLSDDPVMTQIFLDGRDIHTEATITVFGKEIVDHPDFKKVYRHTGKTSNFLRMFRGGPDALHAAILRQTGKDYPFHLCVEAVQRDRRLHAGLVEWQDEQIEHCVEHGYLELPLIGQSRAFPGSRGAVEGNSTVIVNFPVQTQSANVMISAQTVIRRALRVQRLRSKMILQGYDSVYLDCPWNEQARVRCILDKALTNPPYYQDLCDYLGRSIPMEYEIEVISSNKPSPKRKARRCARSLVA